MTIGDSQQAIGGVRRFDRGSWLTLLFVLSFTALCVTASAVVLAQPGDGCSPATAASLKPPLSHRCLFRHVSATGRRRCAPAISCSP
jgi:hypothetical protein